MKILVAVKRVVDYNVKVRLNDAGEPDTATVKMSINPFDEIATECAVQLKEKGIATEVVAVTIGAEKSLDTLRVAMAMGRKDLERMFRGILLPQEREEFDAAMETAQSGAPLS